MIPSSLNYTKTLISKFAPEVSSFLIILINSYEPLETVNQDKYLKELVSLYLRVKYFFFNKNFNFIVGTIPIIDLNNSPEFSNILRSPTQLHETFHESCPIDLEIPQ